MPHPLMEMLGVWARAGLTALVAALAALAGYLVLLHLARRVTRRRAPARTFLDAAAHALGAVVVLLTLQMVWHNAPDDLPLVDTLRHVTTLALIAAITWAAMRTTAAIGDVIVTLNPATEGRQYYARRVETQARFITRMLVVLIVVVGIACALMTFPSVKQLGTSLLASAGIGGLVVGFAARPVLSNLLAGMQIALTQPFRIEDVLNFQGEWCWVEEVTATYVVLRVWDQRRLVVPLNWFIEHPFQNWTRNRTDLLGTVFLWVDYRMPVDALRAEFERLLPEQPEWDGKVSLVQVTEAGERAMQVRFLMSGVDSVALWHLRCRLRERLVAFVQAEYPAYLPTMRARLQDDPVAADAPTQAPE